MESKYGVEAAQKNLSKVRKPGKALLFGREVDKGKPRQVQRGADIVWQGGWQSAMKRYLGKYKE